MELLNVGWLSRRGRGSPFLPARVPSILAIGELAVGERAVGERAVGELAVGGLAAGLGRVLMLPMARDADDSDLGGLVFTESRGV